MFLWRCALHDRRLGEIFLWCSDLASGRMFPCTSGKMFPWLDRVGPLTKATVNSLALGLDQPKRLEGGKVIAQSSRRHATASGKLHLRQAHLS
jgi:hypothetical protein